VRHNAAVKYLTVLLDFDHTLFDFDASEAAAFSLTLASVGVDGPERHLDTFHHINRRLWVDVELGLTSPARVHVARFEQLIEATGLDADPVAMAGTFAEGLGANGDLYGGAREVLTSLAEHCSLAMITNGLSEVQRPRIERLDIGQYFDAVVISAEVGHTKPRAKIFDIAFSQLTKPSRATTVMVGDSLSSDIDGGTNFGIATCWYNPHGATAAAKHKITHEVTTLEQLPALVNVAAPGAT